jgi:hypothetical protein
MNNIDDSLILKKTNSLIPIAIPTFMHRALTEYLIILSTHKI